MSNMFYFLSRVKKIVVRIKTFKIGDGKTPSTETVRSKSGTIAVRSFLNELWREKDLLVNKVHN